MLTLLATAMAALAAPRSSTAPDFTKELPGFTASTQPNMNGDFVLSEQSCDPAAGKCADMSKFPKSYSDYPGGAESFDVWSPPITTLYSQVWWSPLAPSPFPADIVKKYAGKGMAIVGWEVDQVRKGAGPNGEDVSVPISASYNHHFGVTMIGESARFKKVSLTGPDDPRAEEFLKMSGHGMIPWDEPHYAVEQVKPSASGHPVQIGATSSNGGEYRKSFHGFPPGYALLLDSPTAMQISPMQIDTWNRAEMNISENGNVKFVVGPLPASAEAPVVNPIYSALLECPMTTRIAKSVDGSYVVRTKAKCGEQVMTSQECFHAAASTLAAAGRTFHNASGSGDSRPAGCSATVDATEPLKVSVYFNSVANATTACGSGAQIVAGAAHGLVHVDVALDAGKDTATLTLAGPSGVWFGAGFGGWNMADQPWTVVVDGSGVVTERKLQNHLPGTQLKATVKVVSSSSADGRRTVVLTRSLLGASADYFNFSVASDDAVVKIITAVGSGPTFAVHKDKALSSIALLPVGGSVGACICPEAPKPFGLASGKLVYNRVANQSYDTGAGGVGFRAGKCAPYPATVNIIQKNPTCDIRHYRGGQWACHHMWSLLDAEQEIPWSGQPLVFHHKYRFWVQPFKADYHKAVHYGSGSQLLVGSPWEYDVPKCSATPTPAGCSLVNGTWIHTITGSKYNDEMMVTLNMHCHAPTCLEMSVYTCPMGMSLDECAKPTTAAEALAKGYKLLCREAPVYGGSGNPHVAGSRFDEAGYIAIPDCLWGSPEHGLVPPVNTSKVPLFILKTANATNAHYGEMAGGQAFCHEKN